MILATHAAFAAVTLCAYHIVLTQMTQSTIHIIIFLAIADIIDHKKENKSLSS